ncbi:nuclear protein MDM1 isoform X2 [Oryzias latipes]|uniref:Nuclear protein MDM1 n=1 Tax=Oryzias latipes TaxID=8090 RepID=A0A3B3IGT0_ORYLA|nr:nuclear protein MDM1 isoform X2 [Oryzias latipes]
MTVRFKSQTEYQRSFTLPRPSGARALACDPAAHPSSDPTRNTFSAGALRSSAHRKPNKPPTGSAGNPESLSEPEPPAGPRPPADPCPPKRPGLEPSVRPAAVGESDKPHPFRGHSQPQPSSPVPAAAANELQPPPPAMKADHVTRRRAGSKAPGHGSGRQKPLMAASPLLTAEQVLYAGSRGITPYRMKPVSMETEYRRNFRGLIPPTGPRLRNYLDHELEPLFHSYEVNRRTREEEPASKLRLKHDSHPEEEDTPPLLGHRGRRKPEGNTNGAALQVTELRQRALMYRRRAWGANFSRDHLGQLLSHQNALWEPSSTTDSMADASPLAAGPSPDPGSHSGSCVDALDLASVSSLSRSAASELKTRTQRRTHAETHTTAEEEQRPDGLKAKPVQRSRSDLGSPAAGGTVLVGQQGNADVSSPKKVQRSSSLVSMTTEAGIPCGMPVKRKEAWPEKVSTHQHEPFFSPSPKPNSQASSSPPLAPPPLHAIQGSMRHPDFQHNGELGVRLRETSCSGGCGGREDDRLSVMSWRSAASCSAASVVLERAQKRQKSFWGKR